MRHVAVLLVFLLLVPVLGQNATEQENVKTGQSWIDQNFVMPFSNWISGAATGQSKAIVEADKTKGKEFAKEFLGWLEILFPGKIDIAAAGGIIKLFAAGFLIFFLLGQLNPNLTVLQAGFFTLVVVGLLDRAVGLGPDGWYTFLVNFAPAVLVYLVIQDLLSFLPSVSSKTARWIALFGLAFTYWYQPTEKIFQSIFGQLHGFLMSYYLIFAIVGFVMLRIFGLLLTTLNYQAALEARAAYARESGALARRAEDREPLFRRGEGG